MKIQIQTPSIEEHTDLKDEIHKKISKLKRYYDKIIAADVYLKPNHTSNREKKTIEIRLSVPGGDLMVSKQGQNFQECLDLSIDTLKKLIIRKKEKDHVC